MDYRNIDNILNKYFEGISGVQEEKILKSYFSSGQVKPEHASLKPMFDYFEHQSNVINPKPIRLKQKRKSNRKFIAGAAALIIGLGLITQIAYKDITKASNLDSSSIQVSANNLEKKKEIVKEVKKYSKKVNKGIEQAGALSIFSATTHKIFNINKDKKVKK